MADGYLVHSRKLLAMMQASDGAKVSVQHPIPAYSDYPTAEGLLPKRGRLELLFFGYIRPYKGLDVLLDALEQLRDPDVYLTIAGELWGKARRRLVQAAVNPRIDAHLGYVNDAEAAELFERADYVVLPYRSATGSAVAALALNYRKPMIASRIGGLPDVVIDGYTGILVPPSDATALANAISLTNRNEAAKLADGVRDFTLQYGWRSLCDTLVRLA
jgi:glycosyltransferase involved in cell wall biosynthesis